MGESRGVPKPPRGLNPAGRDIWRAVVEGYDLEAHELALLTELCRAKDRLDALHRIVEAEGELPDGRVHPALVEARQLGIAFARLATALRLPAGEEGDHQEGARRPQRRVGARGVYGWCREGSPGPVAGGVGGGGAGVRVRRVGDGARG